MRVVFLPYGEGNPYLDLLASALEHKGCNVLRPRINTFFLWPLWFRWQPDVLHLHWLHVFYISSSPAVSLVKALVFLTQLIAVRLSGTRIIWTVHNLINHEKQLVRLDTFCSAIVARLANRVIVHCQSALGAAEKAFRMSGIKISVIPHGNHIRWYPQFISGQEARQKLGLPPDSMVFLAFGGIHPYKGLERLFDCFHALPDPRARLLVAGQPATTAYSQHLRLHAGTDSRILLHFGFIPDNDVQLYFSACDVAVFTFTEILTSASVILAMSFSRPVIAPIAGCVGEILSPRGGFPYDPSDEKGLPKALDSALRSDRLRDMGTRNRRLAESFDWDLIAEKTVQIYHGPGKTA